MIPFLIHQPSRVLGLRVCFLRSPFMRLRFLRSRFIRVRVERIRLHPRRGHPATIVFFRLPELRDYVFLTPFAQLL